MKYIIAILLVIIIYLVNRIRELKNKLAIRMSERAMLLDTLGQYDSSLRDYLKKENKWGEIWIKQV